MKCLVIVAFLLFVMSLFSKLSAQTAELTEAETAYRAGDYTKAAEVYQTIIHRGLTAGEIYYDLGNCYYKIGSYGRAILNYERACRFLGPDPDLEINLKLANMNVPDRIEPLPRFFALRLVESLGNGLTTHGWALILIASEWVLLACAAGLLYLRHAAQRRMLTGVFITAAVVLIISGGFFLSWKDPSRIRIRVSY